MPAWMGRRQLGMALLTVVIVLGLALAAWRVTYMRGVTELERQIESRLTINLRSLQSEIERFRYLPSVVGRDGRVADLLQLPVPQTVDAANAYLRSVRVMSGVIDIFVLDSDGTALASSNWNEPDSFVGNNYAFRPYFTDAMAAGVGRYYAVGIISGQPGYFLADRVGVGGRALGAVVVKVDLEPVVRTWLSARETAGIADADGVVFLSSDPSWTYRPLSRLDGTTLARLERQRRYDGVNLASADPLDAVAQSPAGLAIVVDASGAAFLLGRRHIEPEGWQVLSALPLDPVEREARLVGGLVAVAFLPIAGIGLLLVTRNFGAARAVERVGPVAPASVFEAALDIVAPRAADAGVVVTAAWEPGLKPVSGNALQLERAFISLLDNAIKASAAADGASVRVIAHGQAPGHLTVDIAASGSVAFLENRPAGFPGPGGRGRSLVVAQALIEEGDGTLSFERDGEGGMVIRVTLPLHDAPRDAKAGAQLTDRGDKVAPGARNGVSEGRP